MSTPVFLAVFSSTHKFWNNVPIVRRADETSYRFFDRFNTYNDRRVNFTSADILSVHGNTVDA